MKPIRSLTLFAACLVAMLVQQADAQVTPLRPHPRNPRILEFRGAPTLLMTYGEHYSSVINSNFDFVPYINELQGDGMNLTRAFLIGFRASDATIPTPLAASPASFLQPWPRVPSSGSALDGGGKWDFSKWNEAYFDRLRSFARECGSRGIVVEMTLFCSFYNDNQWMASPFHPSNNVQGVGPGNRFDTLRPVDPRLMAVQEDAVRRIVRELNEFDNIYYEIHNEPFWNQPDVGDNLEISFHHRMLDTIQQVESQLPNRHLVAHNFPQHAAAMSPGFGIINEHYPLPIAFPGGPVLAGAEALLETHASGTIILSFGETDTPSPVQSRLEAWMFVHGGGAIYNGLDIPNLAYTESNESGNTSVGKQFRTVVGDAANYVQSLDLLAARRDFSWILRGVPDGARAQALSSTGNQYAAYFHHGGHSNSLSYHPIDSSARSIALTVNLPAGQWRATWTRPADLEVLATQDFSHHGGERALAPVTYNTDVALRIDFTGETNGEDENTNPGGPVTSFINGSFESGYLGWTSTGNQAVTSGALQIPDGTRCVVFNHGNNHPNGALEQTFSTTPGTSYLVTFHMGAYGYRNTQQTLGLELRGRSPLASRQHSLVSPGNGKVTWRKLGASFTADATSTVLTFHDRTGGDAGASVDLLLDHVQVTVSAPPAEPESGTAGMVNGGFEGGYEGWNARGNQALYKPSRGGGNCIAFNNGNQTPNGSLSQTIATSPGSTYVLSFDVGVLSHVGGSQSIGVEISRGGMIASQTFNIPADGTEHWETRSLTFNASGDQATVTFLDRSQQTHAIDLLLDNIRLGN